MGRFIRKKCFVIFLGLVIGTSFCGPVNMSNVYAKGDYHISNPYRNSDDITTWDLISFGHYYQNNSDIKESVLWRVLSVEKDTAFLLADMNLDCKPYNSEYRDNLTWETSSIRSWLNNDFYNGAFSESEKKAILTTSVVNEDNPFYNTKGGNNTNDNVFLLSLSEVSNSVYGFAQNREMQSRTREAKGTNYAQNENWWLRTPGSLSYPDMRTIHASSVDYTGRINPVGVLTAQNIGVRPVIRISLSSSEWRNAGAVTSDGTYINQPDKPVLKNAKIKSGKKVVVTLGKKKNSVSGYQIVYSDTKSFKSIMTKHTAGTKVMIKKLKKGKKYYIRVCTYKKIGNKKIYSDFSKTVKIKVK